MTETGRPRRRIRSTSGRARSVGAPALAVRPLTIPLDGASDAADGRRRTAYRGADRRNVLEVHARPLDRGATLALALAALGVPAAVLAIAAGPHGTRLPLTPLVTSASVAATLLFVLATALLAVRWRLVGEAASGGLAPVSLLVGVAVVPASALRLTSGRADLVGGAAAVALFALAAAAVCAVVAARGPDVKADLRPGRVGAVALTATATLALLFRFSPSAASTLGHPDVLHALAATGAGTALVAAVELLRAGSRLRRSVQAAFGIALLAVASAAAAQLFGAASPWRVLPPLLLVSGGAALLAVLIRDLNLSLQTVVRQDVRGRRRWEAAESELALIRRVNEGQEHDINSVLGAVSGALLVLQHQRDDLSRDQADYLTTATREQIQWLRTLLVGADGSAKVFDVTALLGAAVALRSGQPQRVVCAANPDLLVVGRSDRLAMVVNNLLANAAVHAPSAAVVVWAGPGGHDHPGTVEVSVSDDGPGLGELEIGRAFDRGWRGRSSTAMPGSGLGLFQCKELVEAEGGTVELRPTDPGAPAGRCGLTVHLWLPAAPPGSLPED